MVNTLKFFERRRQRNRTALKKRAGGQLRLCVHRTNQHTYAQIIDDSKGVTIAAASTVEKDIRSQGGGNRSAATVIGKLIAERAKAAGVRAVVFDRGGYIYHGRVRALAEAARDAGLQF